MIALIAHDQKKLELVEFVIRHRDVFEKVFVNRYHRRR